MQKYPEADNIQKIRLGINCINQPNFDTIPLSGVQETKVAAKQSQLAGSTGVGSREGRGGRRRWSRRRDGTGRGGEDGVGGTARRHIKKGSPAQSQSLCFSVGLPEGRRRPTLPPGGAVPSARPGLTSLFGMGRGGPPAL